MTKREAFENHGETEGYNDYFDANDKNHFGEADAAYINAVGWRRICRDLCITESEQAWEDHKAAWCEAFKRGWLTAQAEDQV